MFIFRELSHKEYVLKPFQPAFLILICICPARVRREAAG